LSSAVGVPPRPVVPRRALLAVNMGGDADTTGAVYVSSRAFYGETGIPGERRRGGGGRSNHHAIRRAPIHAGPELAVQGTRLSCTIAPEQASRTAIDAEAHLQISHGPGEIRHRPTAFIRGGKSRTAGEDRHERGLRQNSRAESSHVPVRRRERRCNASDQLDSLSGSSQHMLRSTTLLTFVAISSPLQRNVGSGPKHSRRGVRPWASRPELRFIAEFSPLNPTM